MRYGRGSYSSSAHSMFPKEFHFQDKQGWQCEITKFVCTYALVMKFECCQQKIHHRISARSAVVTQLEPPAPAAAPSLALAVAHHRDK